MKRSEYLLPWAVLWLPVVVVASILISIGSVKILRAKPPAPPSLLGPVPQTFLASLDVSPEDLKSKTVFELTGINPFVIKDKPPEPPKLLVEQVPVPKERVRISAVFVIDGRRVCLVNGSLHREGSSILHRGVITGIDTNTVKIRVGNEEKIVFVGQDFEI